MSRREVAEILERVAVRKAERAPVIAPRSRRSLPMAMSLADATRIAGTLGAPSKMPGPSYARDAHGGRRGSIMVDVPGSICSGCFALKAFYASWRPAITARERRHAGLDHPQWVDAMVRLISHHAAAAGVFRWHDSGDLTGVDHFARICEVARRTPTIRHWIPTRQYEDVAEYRRRFGPWPANLCVRLSALMIDSEPPRALPGVPLRAGEVVIPEDLADVPTSTVHTPGATPPVSGKGAIVCRAVEVRDNKCGPCRACWDDRVRNVSYPQH